jgi:hypothetical protein
MTDSFSPNSIEQTLMELPAQLQRSDYAIAQAERALAEHAEMCELAEINASLDAVTNGKDAATRELERKQAVSNNAEVKAKRAAVLNARAQLDELKADNKRLSREFAAMCHIAELHAARLILQAKGEAK